MRRAEQLSVESRAYLEQARQHLRWAGGAGSPGTALNHVADARSALHEAALRIAELKRIEDADDGIPF